MLNLGTCYIIMITFFLVTRLQSKDDIAAEVSGYQDDVVGDEEEVYIAHATTFSNQKMRGIFPCLQL